MSQENVELVRSMYRTGDPNRFFDLLDEEVEIDGSASRPFPDHPEYIRGKDDVIDFYRHYWGTWDDYVLEATECIDAGADRVVVVHHERGSGRGSGTPFERHWAVVWTLREGRLTRVRTFNTREDALEAAGLRE